MMVVTVNDTARELPDGATVATLVDALVSSGGRGVAVAVDGEVVPRTAWPNTTLGDGARIELLTAVQGG